MLGISFVYSCVKKYRFPLLLSSLVICFIAVIEMKRPYFFLRDDNINQNLPYYVHNIRSILMGEFPLFNFHQYLGTPVFSCIQSAALYPPNYAALLLSHISLGHYFGTMEFIALFHLVLAALGFFRFIRFLGLNELSCCFGAIAWALCVFVIKLGNLWIQVIEYAAYFPWILYYSLLLVSKSDKRSFALLVILRVLAIFVGYPPYFIYTFTFDIITVVALYFVNIKVTEKSATDRIGMAVTPEIHSFSRYMFKQAVNYLLVFLLATPLLLPAIHQIIISAGRSGALAWEEYSLNSSQLSYWVKGLLMPFSSSDSWVNLQFMSHVGWLTLFFCFAAIWQNGQNKKLVLVFLALSAFTLLWATDTFVTKLVYSIPIYNRQRYPFKLLFFTSFYLITVSCFGFDMWYHSIKNYTVKGLKAGVLIVWFIFIAHISNFYSLYVPTDLGTYSNTHESIPYQEPLSNMLKDGRIITVMGTTLEQMETNNIEITSAMPLLIYNYATLFDIYHFAGYETLVSKDNLNAALGLNNNKPALHVNKSEAFNPSAKDLDYFRKWGVKWYVLDKNVLLNNINELKLVYRDSNRFVLHDESAMPLIYWEDGSSVIGISHTMHTNSIKITTDRETEGQLIINALYNNFFEGTIDSKLARLSKTITKQITVNIPAGRHVVNISFVDPYFYAGLYVAFGTLLLITLFGVWSGFKKKVPLFTILPKTEPL